MQRRLRSNISLYKTDMFKKRVVKVAAAQEAYETDKKGVKLCRGNARGNATHRQR